MKKIKMNIRRSGWKGLEGSRQYGCFPFKVLEGNYITIKFKKDGTLDYIFGSGDTNDEKYYADELGKVDAISIEYWKKKSLTWTEKKI